MIVAKGGTMQFTKHYNKDGFLMRNRLTWIDMDPITNKQTTSSDIETVRDEENPFIVHKIDHKKNDLEEIYITDPNTVRFYVYKWY